METEMSADADEKFALKEERKFFQCCEGNLSFSTTTIHDDDYNYGKKKISRDPMSHRIIEKRRRDRMNNCLADLSRLIPPEYLKKGRGRIEKTEIIEMAIKHMGHLQSVISSAGFNENPIRSPSGTGKESPSSPVPAQPLAVKHYRMGYLECMTEAIHFLVEVGGYFAGDSLCVQLINHLRRHCDHLLGAEGCGEGMRGREEELTSRHVEYSRKPADSGDSGSASPTTTGNGSPTASGFHRCPTSSYYGTEMENRRNPFVATGRSGFVESDRFHSTDDFEETGSRDGVSASEVNGSSQLREMLTSPAFVSRSRESKNGTEAGRRDASPSSNNSENEVSTDNGFRKRFKMADSTNVSSDLEDGQTRTRRVMYKFKSKIKQRFSKEREETAEIDGGREVMSSTDGSVGRWPEEGENRDERFNVFGRTEVKEEEEADEKSGSGNRAGETISGKSRFGEKSATWLESNSGFPHFRIGEKTWASNVSLPFWDVPPFLPQKAPFLPHYASVGIDGNPFRESPASPRKGIPIFALHANGSFYVPLTLDQATLAPFLAILGIAKGNEVSADKAVLHPVTISVNFQSRLVRFQETSSFLSPH